MMTKEFKTTKGSFLAVELPPDTHIDFKGIYDFETIGIAKNLTEEQWKDIVGQHPNQPAVFSNYDIESCDLILTATESGQSLMKSIGCNIVNPLGKMPRKPIRTWGVMRDKYDNWQAEQDKLVNWLILKIK